MSEPTRRRVVQALGIVVALAAVGFLVATLVGEWPEVRAALASARPLPLVAALVAAGLAMWGLAVLWFSALHTFGASPGLGRVSAWYFAGELGKYLPGGIWPVVGRGELASRAGVDRSVAYGTTLLSLGLMVEAALVLCAVLWPLSLNATGGDATDTGAPPGLWAVLVAVPVGLALLHPAVLGRIFDWLERLTKGRVALRAAPWRRMVALVATSLPTWVLVGLASWAVARSLGYDAGLARTVLAATLAWVVGFLAVPVPAGAGVREVVFVAASDLGTTEAVVVATVARFVFVLADGICGVVALGAVRADRILTDETP